MSSFASRIALFIDGPNLEATSKALGFHIDYRRLLGEFRTIGTVVRAFYYTPISDDPEHRSASARADWLSYNGYTVVAKRATEFSDGPGHRGIKCRIEIDLAVQAMEICPHVDEIMLFSGNGKFRALVEAIQRRGVRVTAVSTMASRTPMIADDLRRQVDAFLDLVRLQQRLSHMPVAATDAEVLQYVE
ncbi:NYN domain-containing protein [Bradyrhizobium erythrophlei]|uniref:LabA-like NYN domain-containing protein n=1 Tax=Bradyrhizobium erythrophlei TaxID=1437360 RepID=UPI0035EA11B2